LVSDTDRHVFDGFTPMKWKGDDSLWSLRFILRYPHGVPPAEIHAERGRKAVRHLVLFGVTEYDSVSGGKEKD
jgi:hypothetical protein